MQLLLASAFLTAIPLAVNLPPLVMGYFTLLLSWRYAAATLTVIRQPSGLPLFLSTLAGFALIFIQFRHSYGGTDSNVSMLLIGVGLKLAELKSSRNSFPVVCLLFLCVTSQCLFSGTGMAMAAYGWVLMALLTYLMVSLNVDGGGNGMDTGKKMRLVALMVFQSAPIMALLFVFFPRINPLWQANDDYYVYTEAQTGLSDHIDTSGGLLVQSQKSAFTAVFNGRPPPMANRLYWRGPVFEHTDGRHWSMRDEDKLPEARMFRLQQAQGQNTAVTYNYTLTLEPGSLPGIVPLLGVPVQYEQRASLLQTQERTLTTGGLDQGPATYKLASTEEYPVEELSGPARLRNLELPYPPMPKVRSLVDGWLSLSAGKPAELIKLALDYIHNGPFYYTLDAPLLSNRVDATDSLLFDSHKGYCVHYASAFAMLMRVAGIPARVVEGYFGGEYDGKTVEVRLTNAHAWVEVWMPSTPGGAAGRWVRVDPTAAIDPQRVIVDTDGRDGHSNGKLYHDWAKWTPPDFIAALDERNFLAAIVLVAAFFTVRFALAYRLRVLQAKEEPAMAHYAQFLRKMAKIGFAKKPNEGSKAFAQRVSSCIGDPEAEAAINKITMAFICIRYSREPGPKSVVTLKRLVKGFRPGKAAVAVDSVGCGFEHKNKFYLLWYNIYNSNRMNLMIRFFPK